MTTVLRSQHNLLLTTIVFLAILMPGIAPAQFLTSPQPGDVYKEFNRTMSGNRDWRVCDQAALNGGAQMFKPNPILSLTISDLTNAIRAEVIIDHTGGHIGTTGKQFRFNNNAWITLPELSSANGIPSGSSGQCYYAQYNPVINIPLNNLRPGTNTFEGNSGAQSCYSFNWGLWGWYGVIVRVYYDPSLKSHPTGEITSPMVNATISENPVITANAQSPFGISRIEFFGSYLGIDPDGDGVFSGYQYSYHRAKTDPQMGTKNHIGTATQAPYQVTWNTDWVRDQAPGAIKMIARIRDNNGVWYVTNEVAGLTLYRNGLSVKYYLPNVFPERCNIRGDRTPRTITFTIPTGDSLTQRILGAQLLMRTWNGKDDGAEVGQTHSLKVNTFIIDNTLYGEENFFDLDLINLPNGTLKPGANSVVLTSLSAHHGIDVLWPGPALIVRYNITLPSIPVVTTDPQNKTAGEGETVTFSVVSTGSGSLQYQWQKDSFDVAGATNSSYTTPPVAGLDNNSRFRCIVSNNLGRDTSGGAILTVTPVPTTIVRQPAPMSVGAGRPATLYVSATGTAPLSYQWKRNGVDISGATSQWYTTPNIMSADNGVTYRCSVSGVGGSITSDAAVVTVTSAAPPSSIVSDDFNVPSLNGALWEVTNPGYPSSIGLVNVGSQDARLSIAIPAGFDHDLWSTGANAPRIMQPANNTDFEIQAKFESQMSSQYQMNGVIVEQNASNYIRFDFVKRTTETRIYSASFVNNTPTVRFNTTIPTGALRFLRVKRIGNTWNTYYSADGISWTAATSFSHTLAPGRVGIFAGNSGSPVPAFTSLTDYFFNVASPISPEDGSAVIPAITLEPSDAAVNVGDAPTLRVAAVGTVPMTFQWQRNGINISLATAATYTTPLLTLADAGSVYRCLVTNSAGADTSRGATISVVAHQSGIRSDDFNAYGLNTSFWTYVDPLGDGFRSMTGTNTSDARLSIALPAGVAHDAWTNGNTTARVMQIAHNTNFELEAKFESPMTAGYQIQGILVQEDQENYLRFDFVRDPSKIDIYAASFVSGIPTTRYDVAIPDGAPLYLRVNRVGNQWNESYSYDGVTWIQAASFTHSLIVTGVGPFVGNSGSNPPPFTGLIDYFFLTVDPVSPEDGGTAIDTYAPVIGRVRQTPGSIGFEMNWITDEPTSTVLQYGLTTGYELGSVNQTDYATVHSLQIFGLQPATSYNCRIIASDAAGHQTQSQNIIVPTAIPTPPIFNIWYGKNQTFGQIGNPVPCINILGNVTDQHGVRSLSYSLNNGPSLPLSMGPNTRRLQNKGDFNADISYTTLNAGANQLVLTAVDSQFTVAYDTVTINYVAGRRWPKSYTVDWSTVSRVEEAVQILDGKWTIENNEAKILEPGYDRLLCIGEPDWVDYEVTYPVTINGLDSAGFKPPSNGAAIGFLLRWPGHSDRPASTAGLQPKSGFLPLGGFGTHNWEHAQFQRTTIIGNELRLPAEDQAFQMALGVRYMMKMRVQTNPGVGPRYFLKIWPAANLEPSHWNLVAQEPVTGPQSGAFLVVAHHVYASIGNITVTQLQEGSTIVSDDFHAATLNTALWQFINPRNDATLNILGGGSEDSRLQVSVPGGIVHELWSTGMTAPRIMQSANNTSFEVDAKFGSAFTSNIQVHGIVAQQDNANFVRFDYSTDGVNTRIFAGTGANGVFTTKYNASISTGNPPYMRVRRLGDLWTLLYSYDGAAWTSAASFSHSLVVSEIGPYFGNTGSSAPAYTGVIDYFFNTTIPITPEDGANGAVPVNIITNPSSQTIVETDTAYFDVAAIGTPPLYYQWQRNGASIPGATTSSYPIAGTVVGDNGVSFRCIVSNGTSADTSNPAFLYVNRAPSTIISDDFHTNALNTSVWKFVNPRNDAVLQITGAGTLDARLNISIPAGASHDVWSTGNFAPRIMQKGNNTNFEVEAKFESGVSDVHQLQGILIQQNATNFIRFDFVTHATSNYTRLFSASFINGAPTSRLNLNTVAKGIQPLYLKVNRSGDVWTVSYSRNGSTWTAGGSFSHPLTVDSVGVFFGNAGTTSPAFTGIIDYFFNNDSPVDPEDGTAPSIVTQPASQTKAEGQRASFSVVGSGSPPLAYQWQRNGVVIPGATSSVYHTAPLVLSEDGTTYRCAVSNPFGTTLSAPAVLHVTEAVPLPWWNAAWNFRIPIDVQPGGYERYDKPVEVEVDFSNALSTLILQGTLDEASLRMVEVNSTGALLDSTIDFQFDKAIDFDPATRAAGTIVFVMDGVTQTTQSRFFQVYFDTVGGGSFTPAAISPQVIISDTANYETFPSFKIWTVGGTYFYHKPGGGFASFIDNNGNDWLSWHPGMRGGGEYRGIPNTGDAFHPGYTNSASYKEIQGPLHTRIRSINSDGTWESVWDIFPRYARMKMIRSTTYWWLYEGTPGGLLEIGTDYSVRPNGQRATLNTPWSKDLPSEEWAYFGDANMSRAIFLAHHEDDAANDYYRHMDSLMTVFGFGRKDPCCVRYISTVPQTFTFGFAEDSTFAVARKSIYSAYKDISVTVGLPEIQGTAMAVPLSTITSDNFNAPSLNSSLWTYYNPRGDAALSMTGSSLQISVPGGTAGHDVWTGGNFAPRIMQPANNTNFQIEGKFDINLALKFQLAGFIVEEDASNYIRFDFVRNATTVNAFAATITNGAATTQINTPITSGNPLYLRVTRLGSQWTHSYSYNGSSWTVSGTFSHTLNVTSVGVFFGNSGTPAPLFHGSIDYFFNTETPLPSSKQETGGGIVLEQPPIPTEYFLSANYPNPFNPATNIRFGLPEAANVRLEVYNTLGQEVITLYNNFHSAGYVSVTWDGTNSNGASVGTGVYIYRLTAIGESGRTFSEIKKMLLLR